MVLDGLPERGWGVLRTTEPIILLLEGAGLIKVQLTANRGVYQACLTGLGRRIRRDYRAEQSSD